MSPNKREFRKLEKKWYEKIKKAGFVDIEDTTKRDRPLKEYHSFQFVNKDAIVRKHKKAPYQYQIEKFRFEPSFREVCATIATYSSFSRSKVSALWDLHVEGKTEREIARAFDCSKTKIHKILEKFRQWMNIV
jgi:hypothetical protein